MMSSSGDRKRRTTQREGSKRRKKTMKREDDGENENGAVISIDSSSSDDVFEVAVEPEFLATVKQSSEDDSIQFISTTRATRKVTQETNDIIQVIGSSSPSQIPTDRERRESDVLFIGEERRINARRSTVASSFASIPISSHHERRTATSSSSAEIDDQSAAVYHDLDAAIARELQQEEYRQAQGPPSITFQITAMREMGMDEATIRSLLQEGTSGIQHHANFIDDSNLDTSYEGLLALSERIGAAVPKGLPSNLISLLSSKKFNIADMADEDHQKCVICLTDYESDEILSGLPCCHYFHSVCIKKWLKESRLCPVCRLDIKNHI